MKLCFFFLLQRRKTLFFWRKKKIFASGRRRSSASERKMFFIQVSLHVEEEETPHLKIEIIILEEVLLQTTFFFQQMKMPLFQEALHLKAEDPRLPGEADSSSSSGRGYISGRSRSFCFGSKSYYSYEYVLHSWYMFGRVLKTRTSREWGGYVLETAGARGMLSGGRLLKVPKGAR